MKGAAGVTRYRANKNSSVISLKPNRKTTLRPLVPTRPGHILLSHSEWGRGAGTLGIRAEPITAELPEAPVPGEPIDGGVTWRWLRWRPDGRRVPGPLLPSEPPGAARQGSSALRVRHGARGGGEPLNHALPRLQPTLLCGSPRRAGQGTGSLAKAVTHARPARLQQ
ncbi:unnamed protein product [Coccothraustes coccothraustes]